MTSDENDQTSGEIQTLQKEIEQLKYQILIQNVLLDDFFNNSPTGYVNLDENGMMLKANVTFLDWLGFTRKTLLQLGEFSNLLLESQKSQFEKDFAWIREGGQTNNQEFTLHKHDGNSLDVYISGKIVSPPGEDVLIRLTIVDVTEKKRTEKDLARKSKEILQQNLLMKKDLSLAAGIQNALLPPGRAKKFISTLYLPLEKVGGDFFDFLTLPNPNKIGIFISDVAGHGVASAFITAIIKSTIHQMPEEVVDNPSELLSLLNDVILTYSDGRFVTALYAVIDFETGDMVCSHAGHPYPYVFNMDTVNELKLKHKRKPLGVLSSATLRSKQAQYINEKVNLKGASRILFFTDGLLEACSDRRGLKFYEELLHDFLMQHRTEDSESLIAGIFSDLMDFLEDSDLNDDVCLVSVDLTINR